MKRLTKQEAVGIFKRFYMPIIKKIEENQGVQIDVPLRRESWNNFTDGLCKNGEITSSQYENWTHPAICH